MKLGFLAIAVFAGVLNPFSGGMNAILGKTTQQAVWAVAATFAATLTMTVAVALLTGQRAGELRARTASRPWSLLALGGADPFIILADAAVDRPPWRPESGGEPQMRQVQPQDQTQIRNETFYAA